MYCLGSAPSDLPAGIVVVVVESRVSVKLVVVKSIVIVALVHGFVVLLRVVWPVVWVELDKTE